MVILHGYVSPNQMVNRIQCFMILMFSAYKVPIVLGYIACDMPAKSFWSSQEYLTTDGWVPILDGFLVYICDTWLGPNYPN